MNMMNMQTWLCDCLVLLGSFDLAQKTWETSIFAQTFSGSHVQHASPCGEYSTRTVIFRCTSTADHVIMWSRDQLGKWEPADDQQVVVKSYWYLMCSCMLYQHIRALCRLLFAQSTIPGDSFRNRGCLPCWKVHLILFLLWDLLFILLSNLVLYSGMDNCGRLGVGPGEGSDFGFGPRADATDPATAQPLIWIQIDPLNQDAMTCRKKFVSSRIIILWRRQVFAGHSLYLNFKF